MPVVNFASAQMRSIQVGGSSPGEEEEGLFPGYCHTAWHEACSSTITSHAKGIGDGQCGPDKQTAAEGAADTSLATLPQCGVVRGPRTGRMNVASGFSAGTRISRSRLSHE